MEFKININKSHAIVIIVLLVVVGFGIAQTPQNPGHSSTQVDMAGGLTLAQWGKNVQTELNNHETDILNLQNGRWVPSLSYTPYYVANLFPSTYIGTYSHNIPSTIPSSAKEILIHAYIARGAQGSSLGLPYGINIYTQQGSDKYLNRISIINYRNDAWVINSDNMWLPVTNDRKVYVEIPAQLDGNVWSQIQIIGYR